MKTPTVKTAGILLALLVILLPACERKDRNGEYLSEDLSQSLFRIATRSGTAPLVISGEDFKGVIRAAGDLAEDLGKVTGHLPGIFYDTLPVANEIILIGTLGKSPMLERLQAEKRIDLSSLEGKWESSLKLVVNNPFPGIDRALVIAGSDKRGTIFGIYDLSEKAGVSPWYWWADVPVQRKEQLGVTREKDLIGEPAVKYRGIFINDEAPALAGWAEEKFGGFNHEFYSHVFELILRMKGNFLWPAMWGRAFYDDDPMNPVLADEYGVVIGTSHHEPLMRAHDEWRRYGNGPWNYSKNKEVLSGFWTKGVERMGSNESILTIGMRGDGDEPMTEGTAIELLETIVKDQREIIVNTTGKKIEEVPQVWALYKEVQDYYDKGMRVPEDVTLLLCDDNWGNIRKLPVTEDRNRKGGFGVYYHFDYVGGPRNYKWLNTNQIERTWEQMSRAYALGVDRIWVVNVGDIKPMELPIQFFLELAWDPSAIDASMLPDYYRKWAREQFGPEYESEIAEILSLYTKYNSRRKPELLDADTYSVFHFREARRVTDEYRQLAEKAGRIAGQIPDEQKDAFFQLVLFPVQACSNLYELYYATALNRLYAGQGRAIANDLALKAESLYARDAELTGQYHGLGGGKWNHMMSQTHIGYTYWQQPEQNSMPEVRRIAVPQEGGMGIAVEGYSDTWPGMPEKPILPLLQKYGQEKTFIDVFNRGLQPFSYTVGTVPGWLKISGYSGKVDQQERLELTADWDRCPDGLQECTIDLTSDRGTTVSVSLTANNRVMEISPESGVFMEAGGYVSMEAAHFSRANNSPDIEWCEIPNLGRTLSGMITLPMDHAVETPGNHSPCLEYSVYIADTGTIGIACYLSPTLDILQSGKLRYAISLDEEEPQIANILDNESLQLWEKWVAANINIQWTKHHLDKPGIHTVRFWLVDPGVVLQKIVLAGPPTLPESYLGPPESFRF
ncbi:MAG: glycosyl hydrolase 115 family protein [Bacteroidota bacterium]